MFARSGAGRRLKEEQWELEVQGRLFTVFILGSAFVEALALIGFVVSLIVK